MRRSTSRTLVCLLLTLTLPIQALAAVAAGICTTLAHHDHAASAQHEHGAGHVHDGSADQQHDDAVPDPAAGNAYCPPCAACCTTTAITSSIVILIPQRPAAGEIAVPTPSFAGIQPGVLYRPPLAL